MLLAAAEEFARDLGRSTVVAYSDHPDPEGAPGDGPMLRAPDGDALLPASAPAAGFAAAHGYSLAQLERVSSLTVGGRVDEFRSELESRTALATASGYRLELWTDRTPGDLVDAYAVARERMVLDVPAGGVTIDEERWDAARVRERESESIDGGMTLLVAAAVTPGGDVAGYTELELPLGREIAYQYDTLVVGPHRGHRLGMLVKLANLVRLAEIRPRSRRRLHVERRRERAHARDQHRTRIPPVRTRGDLAAPGRRRQRVSAGRGIRSRWHLGQRCDERFMKGSRTIGVPHRGHGRPARPYAFREWAKYPDAPFTFTYCASKLVPPSASALPSTSRTAARRSRDRRRLIDDAGCSPCNRTAHSASSA